MILSVTVLHCKNLRYRILCTIVRMFIIFVYCIFRVISFVYSFSCIFTINFVCVLIVYFQNIVYSCITINFTLSYVKIAQILLHSMQVQLYEYTLVTTVYSYMNLHVTVLFIPLFVNAIQYHMRSVTKIVFTGSEGGKIRS